ncbi:MAG: protein phosphatase 2C domain-containing protein [Clostridiales bacterium]|nr:protein phosphatase 2C domain-containing protein [Clostridiales bacterium]
MRKFEGFGLTERGFRHIERNIPCHDSAGYFCGDKFAAAIVSSGRENVCSFRSGTGSEAAVKASLSEVAGFIATQDKIVADTFKKYDKSRTTDAIADVISQIERKIYLSWLKSIKQHFADNPPTQQEQAILDGMDILPNDISMIYSCTLLVAVLTKRFSFAIQIGNDSCVFISESNEASILIPESTSEANAVLSESVGFRFYYTEHAPKGIIVSTSGVSDSYRHDDFLRLNEKVFSSMKVDYSSALGDLKKWFPVMTKKGSKKDLAMAGVYFSKDLPHIRGDAAKIADSSEKSSRIAAAESASVAAAAGEASEEARQIDEKTKPYALERFSKPLEISDEEADYGYNAASAMGNNMPVMASGLVKAPVAAKIPAPVKIWEPGEILEEKMPLKSGMNFQTRARPATGSELELTPKAEWIFETDAMLRYTKDSDKIGIMQPGNQKNGFPALDKTHEKSGVNKAESYKGESYKGESKAEPPNQDWEKDMPRRIFDPDDFPDSSLKPGAIFEPVKPKPRKGDVDHANVPDGVKIKPAESDISGGGALQEAGNAASMQETDFEGGKSPYSFEQRSSVKPGASFEPNRMVFGDPGRVYEDGKAQKQAKGFQPVEALEKLKHSEPSNKSDVFEPNRMVFGRRRSKSDAIINEHELPKPDELPKTELSFEPGNNYGEVNTESLEKAIIDEEFGAISIKYENLDPVFEPGKASELCREPELFQESSGNAEISNASWHHEPYEESGSGGGKDLYEEPGPVGYPGLYEESASERRPEIERFGSEEHPGRCEESASEERPEIESAGSAEQPGLYEQSPSEENLGLHKQTDTDKFSWLYGKSDALRSPELNEKADAGKHEEIYEKIDKDKFSWLYGKSDTVKQPELRETSISENNDFEQTRSDEFSWLYRESDSGKNPEIHEKSTVEAPGVSSYDLGIYSGYPEKPESEKYPEHFNETELYGIPGQSNHSDNGNSAFADSDSVSRHSNEPETDEYSGLSEESESKEDIGLNKEYDAHAILKYSEKAEQSKAFRTGVFKLRYEPFNISESDELSKINGIHEKKRIFWPESIFGQTDSHWLKIDSESDRQIEKAKQNGVAELEPKDIDLDEISKAKPKQISVPRIIPETESNHFYSHDLSGIADISYSKTEEPEPYRDEEAYEPEEISEYKPESFSEAGVGNVTEISVDEPSDPDINSNISQEELPESEKDFETERLRFPEQENNALESREELELMPLAEELPIIKPSSTKTEEALNEAQRGYDSQEPVKGYQEAIPASQEAGGAASQEAGGVASQEAVLAPQEFVAAPQETDAVPQEADEMLQGAKSGGVKQMRRTKKALSIIRKICH